jgi:hypothetical protein
LSEKVCGDRPFSSLTAGTFSRKEGVKISKDLTDPAVVNATRAHEIYHALTSEFLKTLSREDASRILNPDKYSVKELQKSLSLREELEVDIQRCEEFIAYEITLNELLGSLPEQEKEDVKALANAYLQLKAQRLFSRSDADEGVDFAGQKCYQLLPGRYRYDPKTNKGTLILPTKQLPVPDAGNIRLSP